MPLNFLSKYGFVIGAASIVLSLATLYENSGVIYNEDLQYFDTDILGIMLAGIVSCFLILGIVKKCSWLILPSLVTGILGSIYFTYTSVSEAMETEDFDDYITIVIQIGVEVIILYPIYNLFAELRREGGTSSSKVLPANYGHVIQATSKVAI